MLRARPRAAACDGRASRLSRRSCKLHPRRLRKSVAAPAWVRGGDMVLFEEETKPIS